MEWGEGSQKQASEKIRAPWPFQWSLRPKPHTPNPGADQISLNPEVDQIRNLIPEADQIRNLNHDADQIRFRTQWWLLGTSSIMLFAFVVQTLNPEPEILNPRYSTLYPEP